MTYNNNLMMIKALLVALLVAATFQLSLSQHEQSLQIFGRVYSINDPVTSQNLGLVRFTPGQLEYRGCNANIASCTISGSSFKVKTPWKSTGRCQNGEDNKVMKLFENSVTIQVANNGNIIFLRGPDRKAIMILLWISLWSIHPNHHSNKFLINHIILSEWYAPNVFTYFIVF